ncbi:hypothetical protein BDW75DRAFT_206052 [Aspergillus navahoensis]
MASAAPGRNMVRPYAQLFIIYPALIIVAVGLYRIINRFISSPVPFHSAAEVVLPEALVVFLYISWPSPDFLTEQRRLNTQIEQASK